MRVRVGARPGGEHHVGLAVVGGEREHLCAVGDLVLTVGSIETPTLSAIASIVATGPVSPTKLVSNLSRKARSTGPVSRAGSDVANTTVVWLRTCAGTCVSATLMSAMVVGQTSGQCV